jgi:hypothetical protein
VSELPPINKRHRYLIRNQLLPHRDYVSSTNDLGIYLPDGHCFVDTIGVDGLGTVNGSKGIPDFLRAEKRGRQP